MYVQNAAITSYCYARYFKVSRPEAHHYGWAFYSAIGSKVTGKQ